MKTLTDELRALQRGGGGVAVDTGRRKAERDYSRFMLSHDNPRAGDIDELSKLLTALEKTCEDFDDDVRFLEKYRSKVELAAKEPELRKGYDAASAEKRLALEALLDGPRRLREDVQKATKAEYEAGAKHDRARTARKELADAREALAARGITIKGTTT